MARFAVAAVAAVAVAWATGGNVYAGFQTFTLVYGATGFLDPNAKVLGPKLQDLKAPQANYGAVIPYVEGAPRLAGCYIWASNKREIATTTSEGKGGPGVDSTTFSYEIDVLIELAINRCVGIRRVWANGKLVWTRADTADAETIAAASENIFWRDMRFYGGGPDQLPDPTYEAAVGVGLAPAYRTRSTVMIEGLNLGNSGQLPVLTFEVLSEGAAVAAVEQFNAIEGSLPYVIGTPAFSLSGFKVFVGSTVNSAAGTMTTADLYQVSAVGAASLLGTYDTGIHGYDTMGGNTDESLIALPEAAASLAPINYYDFLFENLTTSRLDTSFWGLSQITFSKRGDDIVLVSITAGAGIDRKVRRYNRAGLLQQTSADLAKVCQSIAIGGSFVYVLSSDGATVYQLALASLALVSTIAVPANYTVFQGQIACDTNGTLHALGNGSASFPTPLIRWDGTAWVLVAYGATIGLLRADPTTSEQFGFADGTAFSIKFDSSGTAPYHYRMRYMAEKLAIVTPTLADVVRRLCLRTGQLEAADLNLTALTGDVVRSMAVTTVSSTRATLESLMAAYLFEWAEAETLRAVKRGGASVATIPYEDLGVSDEGDAEPLPKQRINDMEQVARVSVRYANTLNDSQDGLEQADRLVTESEAEALIEIPFGFTPTEARRLADANTMDLAVRILELGPIVVSRKYAHLEVADPITVVGADGSTFRARPVRGTIGNGRQALDLVLDDATAISSVAATDESYVASTFLRVLSETNLQVLDIPILRDADNNLGPYAAVSAGARWSAAQIDKSKDNVTFAEVAAIGTKTAIGRATTTLGNFAGGNVFDELNTVTVDIGATGTLSSFSLDDALAGNAAAYLIGSEIVVACLASLQSTGVYKLSRLLRGQRGTEWAKAGHVSGERVVLLQAAGLLKVKDELVELNARRYYRATTAGRSLAEGSVAFTDTGVALKPFAPVDLRVAAEGAASVLSWNRRSRLAGVLFGAVPLGEATESYDVELRDAGAVLRHAATVSEPRYTISTFAQSPGVVSPVWGLRFFGAESVGVSDELGGDYIDRRMRSFNADGTANLVSPVLGQVVYAWTNDADTLYVVAADVTTNTTPNRYIASKLHKLTRTTIGTIDATSTAAVAGDYFGVAFDGTNVWVSERSSNIVRKLHPTTLASVAFYTVAGNPTQLHHAAGKLYILCEATKQIVRWNIATQTEDWRVTAASSPYDALVVGTLLFVGCSSDVEVRDLVTGALVATHAYSLGTNLGQRNLVEMGGSVYVWVGLNLLALDATTGASKALHVFPFTFQFGVAGSANPYLYLSGSDGAGTSKQTRKFIVAPAALAGYSVTVWQKSAAVGRGYPATLEL